MTPAPPAAEPKMHWFARLEYRYHAWRERRARKRGKKASIAAFPGYGGPGWVRVLGRVLIVPPRATNKDGELASVRGWRSFVGIPVSYSQVRVHIAGQDFDVVADRGGVIDTSIKVHLEPGFQDITMSVEGGEPVTTRVFVVGDDVKVGIVCDVDDTVMVTTLPRPLVAAWNSFVVDEHARLPVPGMAVMLERLVRTHPGSPVIYLSTGAWNIAPTLSRFLARHLFPSGAMLLTDWGPTHDRWFRSGTAHKRANLDRLAQEFPHVRWLLVGDDGQHDDQTYTEFAGRHPQNVLGVAIRRLSPAQAVLAGGRTVVDDHSSAPWVTASDGAGLLERLIEEGIVPDLEPPA